MSTRRGKAPSYRHHRPSGRAFVQYKRRRTYLGQHATPESVQAYERFLAIWRHLADGGKNPSINISAQDLRSGETFENVLSKLCPVKDTPPPALLPACYGRSRLPCQFRHNGYWRRRGQAGRGTCLMESRRSRPSTCVGSLSTSPNY